jgi:hypothetical protein
MDGLLISVFIPLAFVQQRLPTNLGHVYEYLSEAGLRAVNGYPTFMSMKFLSKDDADRLLPMIKKLEQQKIDFLESNDIKEEACQQNPTPPTTDGQDGETSAPRT